MEKKHNLLLTFFSFFSLISISAADGQCHPASCGRIEIRSPFRIIDRQPSSCGSPGFDLYCNKQNQTIIRLPSSRSYTVNRIDYDSHIIYIHQDFCKRNEINYLNVTGTPFVFPNLHSYTFYNCSIQNSSLVYPSVPFPCLSSRNHSVIAVRPEFFSHRRMPSRCKVINSISVSVPMNGDIRSDVELMYLIVELMWFEPCSESCENEGIPTSAKYGLTLGIGLPVVIIWMMCYMASKATDYSETHHQGIDVSPISVIPQPPSRTGLDGPTIESYPITMFGESCRLPSNDSACAICLSDYKTKELLRTIPECNHYFHVDFIDEWLKLNVTCPVCRNTSESSSLVISCSSASRNYLESS